MSSVSPTATNIRMFCSHIFCPFSCVLARENCKGVRNLSKVLFLSFADPQTSRSPLFMAVSVVCERTAGTSCLFRRIREFVRQIANLWEETRVFDVSRIARHVCRVRYHNVGDLFQRQINNKHLLPFRRRVGGTCAQPVRVPAKEIRRQLCYYTDQ